MTFCVYSSKFGAGRPSGATYSRRFGSVQWRKSSEVAVKIVRMPRCRPRQYARYTPAASYQNAKLSEPNSPWVMTGSSCISSQRSPSGDWYANMGDPPMALYCASGEACGFVSLNGANWGPFQTMLFSVEPSYSTMPKNGFSQ